MVRAMREERFNDEILFDRLVDGELSPAERRRLLASLDERPDGWRRCALAFLEAQSWISGFAQTVRDAPQSDDAKVLALPESGQGKHLRQGLAALAIAASLLIAFSIGSMRSGIDRSTAAVSPNSEEQVAAVAPPLKQAVPHSAAADDALTLWVRDDAGRKQSLRVPLVEAGELDHQLGVTFQSAVPARLRERLRERGYDVQSRGRYAPLWLENGRPMIVPVEDTKIVPVSQQVY
jgi:hypothetical protein